MIDQQWGFVAFTNGQLQAGKISESFLLGEKVIKVELPKIGNQDSHFEYHKYQDIKGIRLSSEAECEAMFESLIQHNTLLKEAVSV